MLTTDVFLHLEESLGAAFILSVCFYLFSYKTTTHEWYVGYYDMRG